MATGTEEEEENSKSNSKTKKSVGLITDYHPILIPASTWIKAKNILLNKKWGSIANEEGFSIPEQFYTDINPTVPNSSFTIIGIVRASITAVIFAIELENTTYISKIYKQNENKTLSLILRDDPDGSYGDAYSFGFNIEYPISGSITFDSKNSVIVAWGYGVLPNSPKPKILNINELPFEVDANKVLVDPKKVNLMEMFPDIQVPTFDFLGYLNGGALPEGTYFLRVAYALDETGNALTNWVGISNSILVYDRTIDAVERYGEKYWFSVSPYYDYDVTTSIGIRIVVKELDEKFDSFKISIIRVSNSVTYTYILPELYSITNTDIIEIKTLNDAAAVPAEELLVPTANYTKIKAFSNINNSLVIGNVGFRKKLDYQKYANNIKIKFAIGDEQNVGKHYLNFDKNDFTVEYGKHGFYSKSFMPDEVYSIYIHLIYKDGTISEGFHIPGREGTVVNVADKDLLLAPQVLDYQVAAPPPTGPTAVVIAGGGGTNIDSIYFTTDGNNETVGFYIGSYDVNATGTPNDIILDDGANEWSIVKIYYDSNLNRNIIDFYNPVPTAFVDPSTIQIRQKGTNLIKEKILFEFTKDNPYERGINALRRVFHNRDTSEMTGGEGYYDYSIDPIPSQLMEGYMGFWENQDEFYPDTDDFDIYDATGNIGTLKNKNVRHHKFPSEHSIYYDLNNNGTPYDEPFYVKRVLGFTAQDIYIPSDIASEIQGITFSYAKRDGANNIIIEQVVSHDQREYDNPNYNTFPEGQNRVHGFGLQHLKLETRPSYFKAISFQRNTGGTPLNLVGVVEELTPELSITTTNASNNQYAPIVNLLYYPDYNTALPDGRDMKEANIAIFTRHTGVMPFGFSFNDAYAPTPKNGLYVTIFNLCNFIFNAYNSFDTQSLVNTGYIKRISTSGNYDTGDDIVFGGDVFINVGTDTFSYKEHGVSPDDYVRTLHRNTSTYSPFLSNLRKKDYGIILKTTLYPVTGTPETTAITPSDIWRKFFYEGGTLPYRYNISVNKLIDFLPIIPFSTFNKIEEENPYLIAQSDTSTVENILQAFRKFRAANTRETNRAKGVVWGLQGVNRGLIIAKTGGLFAANVKDLLLGKESEVYLGTGGIFDRDPEESVPITEGYIGCESQFAIIDTPHGVIIVDRKQGRIFLVNIQGKVAEISKLGNERFFRNNLNTSQDEDNPYKRFGIIAAYDEKFDRLLVSKCDFTNDYFQIVDDINYENDFVYTDAFGTFEMGYYEVQIDFNTRFTTDSYTAIIGECVNEIDFFEKLVIGVNDCLVNESLPFVFTRDIDGKLYFEYTNNNSTDYISVDFTVKKRFLRILRRVPDVETNSVVFNLGTYTNNDPSPNPNNYVHSDSIGYFLLGTDKIKVVPALGSPNPDNELAGTGIIPTDYFYSYVSYGVGYSRFFDTTNIYRSTDRYEWISSFILTTATPGIIIGNYIFNYLNYYFYDYYDAINDDRYLVVRYGGMDILSIIVDKGINSKIVGQAYGLFHSSYTTGPHNGLVRVLNFFTSSGRNIVSIKIDYPVSGAVHVATTTVQALFPTVSFTGELTHVNFEDSDSAYFIIGEEVHAFKITNNHTSPNYNGADLSYEGLVYDANIGANPFNLLPKKTKIMRYRALTDAPNLSYPEYVEDYQKKALAIISDEPSVAVGTETRILVYEINLSPFSIQLLFSNYCFNRVEYLQSTGGTYKMYPINRQLIKDNTKYIYDYLSNFLGGLVTLGDTKSQAMNTFVNSRKYDSTYFTNLFDDMVLLTSGYRIDQVTIDETETTYTFELIQTTKRFTKSFSFKDGAWISEHDYFPNYMFNNRLGLFSNSRFNDTKGLYKHNDPTKFGIYYDQIIKYPSYVDVVLKHTAPIQSKVFEGIRFVSNVVDYTTKQNLVDKTVTHIIVYNENQCSGIIPLTYGNTKWFEKNSREVEGEWRFSTPPDILANPNTKFFDKYDNIITTTLTKTKWWDKNLFLGKFVIVRIIYDNSVQNEFYLNHTDISITKSDR